MWSSVALWWRGIFARRGKKKPKMDVPLRCPRRCGHITFTDGENLYVWGGHCKEGNGPIDPPTDELWVYHNKFDCWSVQKCSGDLPRGTSGGCCGVLFPYMYLFCGHCDGEGHSSTVRRLDLRDFVWHTVQVKGPVISPRDKAASWVYKDKLYCFGGYGPDPRLTGLFEHGQGDYAHEEWEYIGWNNQLVIFDPSTNEWSSQKYTNPHTVPSPRAAHAAVLMGDQVFLFGGRHMECRMNDLHCLDLPSLTWQGQIRTNGPEPEGRSWHTLSRLDDDRIFLYGGFSQNEDVFDDAWLYSVSGQRWTEVVSHTGWCRGWHTAVVTNSRDVLIFGGFTMNILSPYIGYEDISDQIVKFQFQPSRLKDLCMQVVYGEVGLESWDQLPKELQQWLHAKRRLSPPSPSSSPSRALTPNVVLGLTTLLGQGDG
ncbi:kelch domain-containing protein 2-like [Babylonia areolata]|uniref:kelch domain-containing protein 2-like n=1 Tax=Babylonia areolata TaxID=304850 RepID=UPI003FD20DD1